MTDKGYYDIIIRGATVIDGSGAPGSLADVAVSDGRIADVGELSGLSATREIEAGGLVVAPGFIDSHTHDDRLLLSDPTMAPKASQGVTTVVAGNCGISLAPLRAKGTPPPPLNLLGGEDWYRFGSFADYLDHVDANPAAVNALFLVGHMTLRVGAMDTLDRGASDREIAAMRERLAEALDAGAAGLSTGLAYDPSRAAPTEEVIALAELLGPAGGIYATHMRNESDAVTESVEETLKIGRCAGARVVISHHKVMGRRNWGMTRQTLARIEEARAGQPVALDVYPYVASSTVLNPRTAASATRTVVLSSGARPDLAGLDLDECAHRLGCTEAKAIERLQPAVGLYFSMDEDDVKRVLAYPGTMIGSDGLPHTDMPHPRLWGTFPRVLGHYCRELGLITLEDAVHRMTGLAAREYGLSKRGLVRPGYHADLVIFDPKTVADRATFEDPIQPAAGIETVLVAGIPVWEGGQPTGERPGRALRRGELRPCGAAAPGRD
ncbi:MAG: D-aminoacylase [Rhodospirillales bacterium]|nr:D-aminoacylase [Rhodospirillales bacterium]